MKRIVKVVALGTVLSATSAYAVGTAACAGCHGQYFEKAALGKSKIVKDMSLKDIVTALKGYKAGTYGGAMKQIMVNQVKDLKTSDIEALSLLMKIEHGTQTEKATTHAAAAAVAAAGGSYIDLNADASDEIRIEQEDLGNRSAVSERALGLRKADLYAEDKAAGVKTDYSRPAPGMAKKFERAYKDAPPMIPHSVDGLLPITRENNQCLGCHLPEVAKSMGATPIPVTHFTNYRPLTAMNDGYVVKDGEVLGYDIQNTADIKLAKARKSDTLYQGRFNCTQCHAPQSKTKTDVANTFKPDFGDSRYKAHSDLADAMNEGVE
jgi:cytochrome c-type protein NapB